MEWSHEHRLDVLLAQPEVRDLIAGAAAGARKPESAEEFLAGLTTRGAVSVALGVLGPIASELYASTGVKTGKVRRETIPAPIGTTLVRTLCSLVRNGQALKTVKQGEDGCILQAELPSDAWSWPGSLIITVQRLGDATEVEVATAIRGQLFDWGKSGRRLASLFRDLHGEPA